MRRFLAVIFGKLTYSLIGLLKLGSGATWPGHIALKIYPQFVRSYRDKFSKVILVSGTNGKTTTAKLITKTFADSGFSVIYNPSGANLLNGIASSLVRSFPLFEKNIDGKPVGVFEVDEGALPMVCENLIPDGVLLLNLFRDQLDRYAELDMTAEKWLTALKKLPKSTKVILGADDPLVAFLGRELPLHVSYFGISSVETCDSEESGDSSRCPSCGADLKYSPKFYSHIGIWSCLKCKNHRPDLDYLGEVTKHSSLSLSEEGKIVLHDQKMPLSGFYNFENVTAAFSVCMQFGISPKIFSTALSTLSPAFGRQEEFLIEGKMVKILLSKNPTGFNENLKILLEVTCMGEILSRPYKKGKDVVLFVLNDGIADGRDVSWIWDVSSTLFQEVYKRYSIVVSGTRYLDMALRIKHATSENKINLSVYEKLNEGILRGLGGVGEGGTLYVIATYTAMLEVRKILVGRRIM